MKLHTARDKENLSDLAARLYGLAPRQTAGSMTFDRCQPRRMNACDYVVQHGIALGKNGVGYDSCQNEAIAGGQVRLTNYAAVIWACGEESTADETFSAQEQTRVAEYSNLGGRLFVSVWRIF